MGPTEPLQRGPELCERWGSLAILTTRVYRYPRGTFHAVWHTMQMDLMQSTLSQHLLSWEGGFPDSRWVRAFPGSHIGRQVQLFLRALLTPAVLYMTNGNDGGQSSFRHA